MSTAITVRLDEELERLLNEVSQCTGRNRSEMNFFALGASYVEEVLAMKREEIFHRDPEILGGTPCSPALGFQSTR